MKQKIVLLSIILMALASTSVSLAAVSNEINIRGYVTDKTSSAPLNGLYTMQFTFYDAETDGNLIWGSGDQQVSVSSGLFSVNLTPSGSFDQNYWVEIRIGSDIFPRQKILAAPYALYANRADVLGDNVVNVMNGNVGIGMTNPGAKLDINGNVWVGNISSIPELTSTEKVLKSLIVNNGAFIYGGLKAGVANEGSAITAYANGGNAYSGYFAGGKGVDIVTGNFIVENGNVGIGTTNPQAKLDVAGRIKTYEICFQGNDCNTAWNHIWITTLQNNTFLNSQGNVGIGTESPTQKLTVDDGRIAITGNDAVLQFIPDTGLNAVISQPYENHNMTIETGDNIYFDTYSAGWGTRMTIAKSGGIGIGTSNPLTILDAVGTIRSTGQTIPTGGAGTELIYSNGVGYVGAINRSSNSYQSMIVTGKTVTLYTGINPSSAGARLTVDENGNVGIGTPSGTPYVAKLYVKGVSSGWNTVFDSGNGVLITNMTGGAAGIQVQAASGKYSGYFSGGNGVLIDGNLVVPSGHNLGFRAIGSTGTIGPCNTACANLNPAGGCVAGTSSGQFVDCFANAQSCLCTAGS